MYSFEKFRSTYHEEIKQFPMLTSLAVPPLKTPMNDGKALLVLVKPGLYRTAIYVNATTLLLEPR